MSVSSDPLYRALAARAAGRMGASSSSMIRAILAQWQCELGSDPYPPRRNNPGNVARGFAASTGIPFTVEFPNPQPSNPIVTFATPEAGADSYAIGLSRFARYAAAMAAARAGDGAGFLKAVSAAGYGTRLSCMLGVYGSNVSTTTSPTGSATYASTTSSTTVFPLRTFLVDQLHRAPTEVFADPLVGAYIDAMALRIGGGLIPDNASNFSAEMRTALAPYIGRTIGSLPDTVTIGLSGAATQSGDFVGQILEAIPGFLVNAGVLVLILVLGYAGLSRLLSPE